VTKFIGGAVQAKRWSAAWCSHTGHVRASNDDRATVGRNYAAVADGVGGSADGAGAAATAIEQFAALAASATSEQDVIDAVSAAHEAILRKQRDGALAFGAATTLLAAVALDTGLLVANVGDSVAWLADNHGHLARATTPQRRWDPIRQRYVLLQALGAGDTCSPETLLVSWSDVACVVLATDGVLAPSGDAEPLVRYALAKGGGASELCRHVVDAILAGPANDNITVAVVRVRAREGVPV